MTFDVLMPVYYKDNPVKFRNALLSVLNNTILPSSLVIIADGPLTKKLNDVISEFDDFILLHRLNENYGIVRALNEGLKLCTSTLVARCDADDFNYQDRFEVQINEFLLDPSLVVCGGQIREIHEKNIKYRYVPVDNLSILKFSKVRNPFNHMSVMFNREVILSLGGYPNIKYREDYALWASVINKGFKCINVNNVLVDVSAGLEMFKRRGSSKDLVHEFQLQKFLLKIGFVNTYQFSFNLLVRGANLIIPAFLRRVIYFLVLRK